MPLPTSPAARGEGHRPRSTGRELDLRIISLALPALGALVAEPVFVLIDSAMVGHLGATSLAGLALASTVLTTVVGLFVFLAYATTATTARLFGAGDRPGGLRAGVDGAWLAALLGVAAALTLAASAPWVVGAMGADGDVAAGAVGYLRASAPGLPGMLIVYACTGTLRGLLDTRTPLLVATAGAVLNVALNAVLIYGAGLGVAGSGLGTALAQTAMAVALAAPVARAARGEGVGLAPRRAGLRASLGAGTPLLVRTLSLRVAILTTVWAVTALGPTALAAHQVVAAVWGFAAFALDALAIAAQALVGRALGQADARAVDAGAQAPDPSAPGMRGEEPGRREEGSGMSDAGPGIPEDEPGMREEGPGIPEAEPAIRDDGPDVDSVLSVLRRSLAWGVAAGVGIGVVVAALSPWIPRLFNSERAVIEAATPALLVAATAMPLAGAVFLLDGILMGAGDGRYLAKAGLMTLVPYVPLAVAVALHWGGAAGAAEAVGAAEAGSALQSPTPGAGGAGDAGGPGDSGGPGGPAGADVAGLTWLWAAFAWVFMGARALVNGLRARGSAWRH